MVARDEARGLEVAAGELAGGRERLESGSEAQVLRVVNSEGQIHILSPWRLVDYWRWTREPDLRDFAIS